MENASAARTNVFLVEDSAPIRARLSEMLGSLAGVTVVGEAESPASAIDGILRTQPDSVVLDLRLSGGTGIEVLRKVCPVAPHIVFIMLTNHSDPQYRKVCLQNGATHFLDKSTEFDKIKEVIAGLATTH
jgi:DNA-binding NarL/FixJ family response regulator